VRPACPALLRTPLRAVFNALPLVAASQWLHAGTPAPFPQLCTRPRPAVQVAEPMDLRSTDGVLRVELTIRNDRGPDGIERYCYVLPDGTEAPTLRLNPGDLLILKLRDGLASLESPGKIRSFAGSERRCVPIRAPAVR